MLLHDQHMHSSFSKDSHEDLRNYFEKAVENNINFLCTCEHNDFYTVVDGTTWDCDYDKLIKYSEELEKEFPSVKFLLGIEMGYKKRCLREMNDLVNAYDFDLVQLSIHDNDKWDYYFTNAFDMGIKESMEEYFSLMLEGMNCFNNYEVLSHIDFAFKTAKTLDCDLGFKMFDEKIRKVLKLLIKKNKCLEVNTKVQSVIYDIDKNDSHVNYLLGLYKELGGKKITLSSDAHEVSKYRYLFPKYLEIIKNNGFEYVSYFIKRKEYLYKL